MLVTAVLVATLAALLERRSVAGAVARIQVAQGSAEALAPGSPAWQAVANGLPIVPGTRLRTDERGYLLLDFGGQAAVELQPGAEVVVERIDRAAETPTLQVRQHAGTVGYRAGDALEIEVLTPLAMATAREATFSTAIGPSYQLRVVSLAGKTVVLAQGVAVAVDSGERVVVEPGQPPRPDRNPS